MGDTLKSEIIQRFDTFNPCKIQINMLTLVHCVKLTNTTSDWPHLICSMLAYTDLQSRTTCSHGLNSLVWSWFNYQKYNNATGWVRLRVCVDWVCANKWACGVHINPHYQFSFAPEEEGDVCVCSWSKTVRQHGPEQTLQISIRLPWSWQFLPDTQMSIQPYVGILDTSWYVCSAKMSRTCFSK